MRASILLVAAVLVAACQNTAQGVKKDASIAVEKTEDAVKRAGRATGSALERAGEAIERKFEK